MTHRSSGGSSSWTAVVTFFVKEGCFKEINVSQYTCHPVDACDSPISANFALQLISNYKKRQVASCFFYLVGYFFMDGFLNCPSDRRTSKKFVNLGLIGRFTNTNFVSKAPDLAEKKNLENSKIETLNKINLFSSGMSIIRRDSKKLIEWHTILPILGHVTTPCCLFDTLVDEKERHILMTVLRTSFAPCFPALSLHRNKCSEIWFCLLKSLNRAKKKLFQFPKLNCRHFFWWFVSDWKSIKRSQSKSKDHKCHLFASLYCYG